MTIIGLCGYAQSGKDAVADILVSERGFERIAFADAMREMLYALNPLIPFSGDAALGHDGTNCVRLQWLVDAIGWDNAKCDYPEVRELMQRLGTEVGREILGQDIWVETAMKRATFPGDYVLTDVRFPNEADAVMRAGFLWRIVRPDTGPVNGHVSEIAIDHIQADQTIANVAGIPELREMVLATLDFYKAQRTTAERALARSEQLRKDL